MTKTQADRLQKIKDAGSLKVSGLNAADHWLKAQGLITWTSEPNLRRHAKTGFHYFLTAV